MQFRYKRYKDSNRRYILIITEVVEKKKKNIFTVVVMKKKNKFARAFSASELFAMVFIPVQF